MDLLLSPVVFVLVHIILSSCVSVYLMVMLVIIFGK